MQQIYMLVLDGIDFHMFNKEHLQLTSNNILATY